LLVQCPVRPREELRLRPVPQELRRRFHRRHARGSRSQHLAGNLPGRVWRRDAGVQQRDPPRTYAPAVPPTGGIRPRVSASPTRRSPRPPPGEASARCAISTSSPRRARPRISRCGTAAGARSSPARRAATAGPCRPRRFRRRMPSST
jgi:hypothetical protein